MLSFTTQSSLLFLTILLSTRPTTAVDINFYNAAACSGAIAQICPNWAEGSCCGDVTKLWQSVQALPGTVRTTATSGQNGNPCAIVLGQNNGCVSVPSAIQGAAYSNPAKRDAPVLGNGECTPPSMVGVLVDGKSYQLHINGTNYAQLQALEGDEDTKVAFIKANAERVVDA